MDTRFERRVPAQNTSEDQSRSLGHPLAWFTLDRTALVAILGLAFAIAMRPATDNDTWWHLRSGKLFVARHGGLGIDPLSHTSGIVRPPSDWLGQVGMYLNWRVAGFNGLAIGVAILATLGCALIADATRGPALARAALVGLAAATSSIFWSARPQMVSFLGSCLVVWVLARARRGILPPWWLAGAFVLWSNIHLGWVYGLAVLWATIAGIAADGVLDRLWPTRPAAPAGWPEGALGRLVYRRLIGVSIASSVACLMNPVGWNGPRLILTQVSVGTGFVEEGQPPTLGNPGHLPFFLLLGITTSVVIAGCRRIRLAELVPLVMLAGVALTAVRTASLFAAAAAPFVAWRIDDYLTERGRSGAEVAGASGRSTGTAPAFNVALVGVVAVFVAMLSIQRVSPASTDRTLHDFPVEATEWVRTNQPAGPLLNTFDWGGWFTWELTDYPVSIDGRAELYVEPLKTYGNLEAGKGVSAELDRQRDNLAVVPTGSPLARAIADNPGWQLRHRDGVASVFVRRALLSTGLGRPG